MDLDFMFIKYFCPMKDLNAVIEGFIKNQLVVVVMLLWSFLILGMFFAYQKLLYIERSDVKKKSNNNILKFPERIGLSIIKIVLFGYKNVATFSIVIFHCVTIQGMDLMFIYGEQKCFSWWQKVDMFFFAFWVVPFPAALMISYRLYMRHVLPLRMLVLSIAIPLLAFFYKFQYRSVISLQEEENEKKEVLQLLKENFEQAYRKRKNKPYYVFWETWRLYQRLILACITTFAINPVNRICYVAPLILFFIGVYWVVRPYKKQYVVLHWMEVAGLLGITFTLINNMFRSFLYVFEIPDEEPIPTSLRVLYFLDTLASPVFVLVYFYVLKPIGGKIWNVLRC